MNKLIASTALGTLLLGGIQGCAHDTGPTAVIPAATPTVQQQWRTVDGQVIRKEGDAYIIQDPTGRQLRVFLDKNSVSDPVVVGDAVTIRYDEPTGYATSIRRVPGLAVTPAAPSRPQVVEGIVQRLEGNDYVIKDLSGSEVRLHVDRNTRLDRNIIAGDRIVAVTNVVPADGPYVNNMYILGSPGVVQGQVVRIDGTSYVLRDSLGREIRLNTNAATVRNGNVMVGDQVVAYLGPSSTAYAESITKR